MHKLLPAFEIRYATESDVETIVGLVDSAYRGDSSRAGWTTEADLLEGQRTDAQMVRQILTKPGAAILVGEIEGNPVSCMQLEDRGEYAYFGLLAVDPSTQGAGIGRKMILEAERAARDDFGVNVLAISVISARTDLISWYERLGFVATGETEDFPYGDPRFGIPTREGLKFASYEKRL